MRLMFVTIAAALTGAIAIAGSGAASSGRSAGPPTLVHDGTLTVATYGTGFPTIVVNKNGTIGGTSGAWINAYAKANGLKVKLFQTTFTSAILAVQQKKADLTMDIYYTPERAKSLYYTYPFSVEGLQVFTKSDFPYTGPSSLKGHKVAAVSGVVWTDALKKYFGSDLQAFPSQAQAATGPHPRPRPKRRHRAGFPTRGQFGLTGYAKGFGYIIVSCGAKDLAAGLNATLTQLEKSGKWAAVLKQAGAPAGTLAAQIPPRTSPKQGC